MRLCGNEFTELVLSAPAEKTDVLFVPSEFPSGEEILRFASGLPDKSILLFPCLPVVPEKYGVCIYSSGVFSGNTSARILIASSDAVCEDEFIGFITKKHFTRLTVLFAECALPFLYGHCRGMALIGDFRASLPYYLHLTAVFSENIDSREKIYMRLFGCENAVAVGKRENVGIVSCDTLTEKGTFYRIADECEKRMTVRKAVFFPDRRHAEEFASFMYRRGTMCPVFHGGKSPEEQKAASESFIESGCGMIAATKSFIPSALFALPFKAMFCGVPPDPRVPGQIPQNGGDIFCVYCPEDIKTALRIRNAHAALLSGKEQSLFLRVRTHSLEKMIDILKN